MYIYIIAWSAVVLGNNSTSNAGSNFHNSQVHYVFLLEICGDLVTYTFLEMILNKEFDEQCFHLLKQICGGYLGFSKWWL